MKDLIYWRNFCSTYDTHYLDIMSINSKALLKKYLKLNVKFKSLQRILELYFNSPKIIKCDILTDIISLSYHTSIIYKKNIYIFGEHHNPKSICSLSKDNVCNVYDFVINMLNTPKMIDFYLEAPIFSDQIPETITSSLDKFNIKFKSCLDKIKNCKYPNVRFHSTDVRLSKSSSSDFFTELFFSISFLYDYIIGENLEKYNQSLATLSNILENKIYNDEKLNYEKNIKSYDELISYILNYYNSTKIMKQYESVFNKHIKQILMEYLYDEITNLNLKYFKLSDIKTLINKLSKDKLPTDNEIIKNIKAFSLNWLKLTTYFMDVYLMSRLFRSFKQVDYQNSKDAENIIIYVGYEHADNYRKILKKLAFKQIFHETSKKNEYCINISKLKYPLFHSNIY